MIFVVATTKSPVATLSFPKNSLKKTADISQRQHWFLREMTSEENERSKVPRWWRVITKIWVVFLIDRWNVGCFLELRE